MSKEAKITMVPRFRFPAFNDDGDWVEKSIGSIGEVITGNTPSKEDKQNWGGDFVWITAQDFKTKYITTSTLKITKQGKDKSRVVPKYSVLVTCIASIGLNGINKVPCATNQQINAVVCNPDNYYEFVYYAISFNNNRLKNLAGQTAVPIISKGVFETFTIAVPKNPKEQQKIGDCLSSLDEHLTAQSEKLDALKSHKKGLMRLLFPAEGETVPKLRFAEFRDSGEWKEKSMEEIFIEAKLGGNYENSEANKGIPVIKMGNLDRGKMNTDRIQFLPENEQYNNEDVLKTGDLLFNTRNTLELVGKVAIWRDELPFAIYNSNLLRMKFKNEYVASNYFMNYAFNTQYALNKLRRISTGTTSVAAIYGKDLNSVKIDLPSIEEQQKIAECLSSLDELITAQTEKLEALKAHKKGLMQQLFPDTNDIN